MQHNEDILTDDSFEPVFVARQPIFDRRQRIWGYELLFRHSDTAAVAKFPDPDEATAKVIADGYALAAAGLPQNMKLLINFPRNLLLNDTIYALPPKVCVVEILETVLPEPLVVDALAAAKKVGYTLALDDFVGQPGYEAFLKIADIVKVEVLGQSRQQLASLTELLQDGKTMLLAEKVEDKETFEYLLKLGYHLFQGFYFSKPEIVPGRKISSNSLTKLQLLQELGKTDYEIKELAEIISTDVSLSYRLLNYLNSPAFSLRRHIETIHQAITILGSRSTRQWLMVIILSDLSPSPRAAVLGLQSIHRARFFQLAAEAENVKTPHDGERMFLLGLLSLLDLMLGHTMQEIIGNMPLDASIKAALMDQDNSCHTWLEVVRALENADWKRATELLKVCGMSQEQAARMHAAAAVWANNILHESSSTSEA